MDLARVSERLRRLGEGPRFQENPLRLVESLGLLSYLRASKMVGVVGFGGGPCGP